MTSDTLDFRSRHVFESFEHLQSVLDRMPLKAFEWAKLGKKLASYHIIITLVVKLDLLEQVELVYYESLPLYH